MVCDFANALIVWIFFNYQNTLYTNIVYPSQVSTMDVDMELVQPMFMLLLFLYSVAVRTCALTVMEAMMFHVAHDEQSCI